MFIASYVYTTTMELSDNWGWQWNERSNWLPSNFRFMWSSEDLFVKPCAWQLKLYWMCIFCLSATSTYTFTPSNGQAFTNDCSLDLSEYLLLFLCQHPLTFTFVVVLFLLCGLCFRVVAFCIHILTCLCKTSLQLHGFISESVSMVKHYL